MFIIFRWWFFAGALGIGLLVKGGVEAQLASKCSDEPTPIEVKDLESGAQLDQPYVKVGQHVALYRETVTRQRKTGTVESVMYPIVEEGHPYLEAWERLLTKYGCYEDIPIGQIPTLDGVRVLVLAGPKTPSWDEAQRGQSRVETQVVGVAFPFAKLSKDEKEEVQAALERHDLSQVIVVQAGRTPMPITHCIAFLVCGAVALGWAIKRFRRPAVVEHARSA